MHDGVQAYHANEALSTVRTLLRVQDEITETHQEIQGHQSDHLVESLHIVREVRFEGSRPLQEYYHSDRSPQLNSDLTPEELYPEDKREAEEDSANEEGYWNEK